MSHFTAVGNLVFDYMKPGACGVCVRVSKSTNLASACMHTYYSLVFFIYICIFSLFLSMIV